MHDRATPVVWLCFMPLIKVGLIDFGLFVRVLSFPGGAWMVRGWLGFFLCFLMESLILAQDERWRRA